MERAVPAAAAAPVAGQEMRVAGPQGREIPLVVAGRMPQPGEATLNAVALTPSLIVLGARLRARIFMCTGTW